jgi:hypothetical protein
MGVKNYLGYPYLLLKDVNFEPVATKFRILLQISFRYSMPASISAHLITWQRHIPGNLLGSTPLIQRQKRIVLVRFYTQGEI